MMGPAMRSDSPSNSPKRVGQNTMEAVREFLQDMTKTIELLCDRYNTAAHTIKSSPFEGADVRTSLSIGMPSISLGMLPTTVEVPANHLRREMSSTPQAFLPAAHLTHKPHYEESKLGQMQHWFSQGSSVEERMQGRRSSTLDGGNGRNLNAGMFETEGLTYRSTFETSSQGHTSESKNGDALRIFLEDMKNTIQAWSARHNLLVQGNAISTRESAEMLDVVETPRPAVVACSQTSHLGSNVQVVGQLEHGADGVSFPGPKNQNQDVDVVQVLGQPNQREEEAREMPQSDHGSQSYHEKSDAAGFPQPDQGKTEVSCFPQPDHGKADVTCFPQHDHGKADVTCFPQHELREGNTVQLPQHDHEPPPRQEVADLPEPFKEAKVAFQSPSSTHPEADHVQIKPQLEHGEMDVEPASRNDSGEVDNLVTPKVDQVEAKTRSPADWIPKNLVSQMATPGNNDDSVHEVTIQPYHRRVDLVGSPDWLPKGWITEVKTRGSGHSAGSKDKYYFDPVSKRRFRSKKEVFCFLETGKLGRYKRRPKIKPVKKLLGTDHPSPGQVNEVCQIRTGPNGCETSGMPSSSISQQNVPRTSGPSPVPSVTAPPGLFSNVFMPYRPGQPSEWLVYESLASLPLPVFEHFRYAEYNLSKSNGNRGSATRPWFLNNSEGSWRPFADKSDVGKSAEKGKDVMGLQSPGGGEMHVSETVPKHSATGTKKFCKKSSS